MIPVLESNGLLPLGRYSTSIDEVEDTYVSSGNAHRQELWKQWKYLTRLVQATVGILPAVWLGGSFVSSKEEPNDIDTVYILKRENIINLSEDQGKILNLIQAKKLDIGVDNVEPFFLYIDEMQDSDISAKNGSATESLIMRGYWDQLWSRSRASNFPAYPHHGYLEVIIDGYQ